MSITEWFYKHSNASVEVELEQTEANEAENVRRQVMGMNVNLSPKVWKPHIQASASESSSDADTPKAEGTGVMSGRRRRSASSCGNVLLGDFTSVASPCCIFLEIAAPESVHLWADLVTSFGAFCLSHTSWVCYAAFLFAFIHFPSAFLIFLPLSMFLVAMLIPFPVRTYWNIMMGYVLAWKE